MKRKNKFFSNKKMNSIKHFKKTFRLIMIIKMNLYKNKFNLNKNYQNMKINQNKLNKKMKDIKEKQKNKQDIQIL